MMEHEALLAAVLTNPDDDAPRLVYADWLQEHGQPERAEFIRVQIEKALLEVRLVQRQGGHGAAGRRNRQGDRQRLEILRGCEVELFNFLRGALVADLPGHRWSAYRAQSADDTPDPWTAAVHRGFIKKVTLPAADWLRDEQTICRVTPVREVWLTTRPNARARHAVHWDKRLFRWRNRGITVRLPDGSMLDPNEHPPGAAPA